MRAVDGDAHRYTAPILKMNNGKDLINGSLFRFKYSIRSDDHRLYPIQLSICDKNLTVLLQFDLENYDIESGKEQTDGPGAHDPIELLKDGPKC